MRLIALALITLVYVNKECNYSLQVDLLQPKCFSVEEISSISHVVKTYAWFASVKVRLSLTNNDSGETSKQEYMVPLWETEAKISSNRKQTCMEFFAVNIGKPANASLISYAVDQDKSQSNEIKEFGEKINNENTGTPPTTLIHSYPDIMNAANLSYKMNCSDHLEKFVASTGFVQYTEPDTKKYIIKLLIRIFLDQSKLKSSSMAEVDNVTRQLDKDYDRKIGLCKDLTNFDVNKTEQEGLEVLATARGANSSEDYASNAVNRNIKALDQFRFKYNPDPKKTDRNLEEFIKANSKDSGYGLYLIDANNCAIPMGLATTQLLKIKDNGGFFSHIVSESPVTVINRAIV